MYYSTKWPTRTKTRSLNFERHIYADVVSCATPKKRGQGALIKVHLAVLQLISSKTVRRKRGD